MKKEVRELMLTLQALNKQVNKDNQVDIVYGLNPGLASSEMQLLTNLDKLQNKGFIHFETQDSPVGNSNYSFLVTLLDKGVAFVPFGRKFGSIAEGVRDDVMEKLTAVKYEFDFAFSYAGEDAELVRQVSQLLEEDHIKVYDYQDSESQTWLWGKSLAEVTEKNYERNSRFCVAFISSSYISKKWTMEEFNVAAKRRLTQNEDGYLLPIYLDNSVMIELDKDIVYRSKSDFSSPRQIADLLQKKLNLERS